MSPELFFPEEFGLKDCGPTKKCDCYSLGMVMYEVLSGKKPFSQYEGYSIIVRIHQGELPMKSQGAEGRWLTDGVWNILERCWERSPSNRPKVEDVLCCLEAEEVRDHQAAISQWELM